MSDSLTAVMEPVPGEPPKKPKGDLGIRTLSALVMVALAGGAFWAGGLVLQLFVALIGIALLWEWWGLVRRIGETNIARTVWMLAGLMYIGTACYALPLLTDFYVYGSAPEFNFFETIAGLAICAVVATDVGAYFSGRTFGGPKIAPSISPSKTWSGLIGGSVAASMMLMLLGLLHDHWLQERSGIVLGMADLDWSGAVITGSVIAIVAQSGDFLESWMKRRAGVKDSGSLIPGHGGFLDRVDGLLAVVFVLTLLGLVGSMLN